MTTTPLTNQQLADRLVSALATALSTQPCSCGVAFAGGCTHPGARSIDERRSAAVLAVVQPELDRMAAELDQVRAELAAVLALCDAAEHQATRWEDPLPVPEWVTQVRNAGRPGA